MIETSSELPDFIKSSIKENLGFELPPYLIVLKVVKYPVDAPNFIDTDAHKISPVWEVSLFNISNGNIIDIKVSKEKL